MARTMLLVRVMKATFASLLFVLMACCYGGGLVEVEPGVQVVADYDYPVFFNGGFYYRYDNGYWMRARDYRHGGWERTREVPHPIARIDRPERYRHYHAPSRVVHRDRR